VELGCWLAEQKLATAMMDVSDGFVERPAALVRREWRWRAN